MPAIGPRTGDIAPAGTAAIVLQLSGQFGRGGLRVRDPSGDTHVQRGDSGTAYVGGGDAGPPANMLPNPELQLRIGTGGSCEIGAVLGVLRFGPEVRCGVWQQDRGDAVSVAASAAWFWQLGSGSEWRAGVDVSHHDARADTTSYAAVGGAYLTYGNERHEMWLDQPHLGRTGPRVTIVRKELRLTVPLAVAINDQEGTSEDNPVLIIGVVPYWTVRSRPAGAPDCAGCAPGTQVLGYDAPWGFGLAMGFAWPSWSSAAGSGNR